MRINGIWWLVLYLLLIPIDTVAFALRIRSVEQWTWWKIMTYKQRVRTSRGIIKEKESINATQTSI